MRIFSDVGALHKHVEFFLNPLGARTPQSSPSLNTQESWHVSVTITRETITKSPKSYRLNVYPFIKRDNHDSVDLRDETVLYSRRQGSAIVLFIVIMCFVLASNAPGLFRWTQHLAFRVRITLLLNATCNLVYKFYSIYAKCPTESLFQFTPSMLRYRQFPSQHPHSI